MDATMAAFFQNGGVGIGGLIIFWGRRARVVVGLCVVGSAAADVNE